MDLTNRLSDTIGLQINEKKIGGGAYANVFHIEDYAVKIGLDDEAFACMVREAAILNDLREGIHIAELLGTSCTQDGMFAIVMPFYEGGDLRTAKITKRSRCEEIVRNLAQGMEYYMDRDIIHRDIKPENIFLTKSGSVRIGDFGLGSPATGRDQTSLVQTRWYRAPEVFMADLYGIQTEYTFKLDIWSLGCIIAEMIWGGVVFNGMTDEQSFRYITGLLGIPSADDFPKLRDCADRGRIERDMLIHARLPKIPGKRLDAVPISKKWKRLDAVARRCLVLDPKKRAGIAEVLHILNMPTTPRCGFGFGFERSRCPAPLGEEIVPPIVQHLAQKVVEFDISIASVFIASLLVRSYASASKTDNIPDSVMGSALKLGSCLGEPHDTFKRVNRRLMRCYGVALIAMTSTLVHMVDLTWNFPPLVGRPDTIEDFKQVIHSYLIE